MNTRVSAQSRMGLVLTDFTATLYWADAVGNSAPPEAELDRILKVAAKSGGLVARPPLTGQWIWHGNRGRFRTWLRTSATEAPSVSWRDLSGTLEVATIGTMSFEVPGPSRLEMVNNKPLTPARICPDRICTAELRVPPEHAYWTYRMALHNDEEQTWEFFRRVSGQGLGNNGLMTSEEVATLAGVSLKTLRNWRANPARNAPAPVRKLGRTLLFDRAEILTWLGGSR